jgi:tetrahydromethanopterin S-methyltransferase subunit B
MKQLQIRLVLILAVSVISFIKVTSQVIMPEVLLKSSLKEQYDYISEHTRIYEDYRAIREDMFQKLKGNVSDTLFFLYNKIAGFNKTVSSLNKTIDTLKNHLSLTQTSLEQMTRTKNSIQVAGIEVNKPTYNKIMWTMLAALIAALLIGILAFKRNLSVMSTTKKESQELKTEFEAYRKTSREAREKLTMDHFNELKKLKGE